MLKDAAAQLHPIPWDVYEEHLDEASFLWGQWEAALESANYAPPEVAAGPEARLLAHLDALVLGRRLVAERLLLPTLAGDDPDPVRPATWALLQAEDADHIDAVMGGLAGAEPPTAGAIVRAMGLSNHPTVVPRMALLWTNASSSLRAMILDLLARRDLPLAAECLPETLRASDPKLLAVGLSLVRRLPDPNRRFARDVDDGLTNTDARVRCEAIATGFARGNRGVWEACRQAVGSGEAVRLPIALLALSPNAEDRELLRDCLKRPPTARVALWALGFAGDVASADAVEAWLGDEKLGPLAAEAFSAITGLVLAGSFSAARKSAGPDDEVGADDPPPEVRPDDDLPVPAPEVIRHWWRQNRGRFEPRRRYVAGIPRTAEALRAALGTTSMWRREVLALELAAAREGMVTLDVKGWTRELVSVPRDSPRVRP